MTDKFKFNDPVVIRRTYPVHDLHGREGRILGPTEDSIGLLPVYKVHVTALADTFQAREDDLSLLAEAHPFNHPLAASMEVAHKSDVVRSDGKEANVGDGSPQWHAPFIVIASDDFAFPELVGKTGRIVGRYLQTDSWHVVIGGERYVLARDNIVLIGDDSEAARQTPHLRVIERGVNEAGSPLQIKTKDGNLIIDGQTYLPAGRVAMVAMKYARRHDWCEIVETKVFPELGIEPPPPRMITFTVSVPEDVFLEDVDERENNYVTWEKPALAGELAGTIQVLESRRQLDQMTIEITAAPDDDPEN